MRRSFNMVFISLVLTFVLTIASPIPAAASNGIITGDSIPAGMVLEQDAILTGQDVAIDGKVVGNVFVLGNQVTVNGEVDGNLILIGQNASIGGTVTGGVYALSLTLDLASPAALGRDLYVAAVSLTSGADSVISRDLFALGLDSGLNGQVGRNLHTAIGPIQLYNGLMTLLGFDDLTLQLHFETPQTTSSSSSDLISAGRPVHYRIAALAPVNAFDWNKWALTLLRNWGVLFAFSLLVFWLARKPLERSGDPLREHPWQTLGNGLLVLVIAFALIGVAILLAALIFAIGLGLISLGLWQLALIFWITAYACLALALVGLWFFIAYGTKIIAIFLVMTWLFSVLFHRKAVWMDILGLLAGTVVYSLLRTAPYVGWVFGVAITAAGAGSAWLAYRHSRALSAASPERPAEKAEKRSEKVVPTKKARKHTSKA